MYVSEGNASSPGLPGGKASRRSPAFFAYSGRTNSPALSDSVNSRVTSSAGLSPKFFNVNVGGTSSLSFEWRRARKTASPFNVSGCGQQNTKSRKSFSSVNRGRSCALRASRASSTLARAASELRFDVHALMAAKIAAKHVATAVVTPMIACVSGLTTLVPLRKTQRQADPRSKHMLGCSVPSTFTSSW